MEDLTTGADWIPSQKLRRKRKRPETMKAIFEKMYKIAFINQNCSSIGDGICFWFVDDLENFEEKWLPLQTRTPMGLSV